MHVLVASLLFLLPLVSPLASSNDAFDLLVHAKSIRCKFDQGTVAVYKSGTLTLKQERFGEDNTFTFDSINPRASTARLIANAGAGDVTVLPTMGGLTFVETTTFGSVNVTTVFGDYATPSTQEYIGVTSRHVAVLGGPIPSQYHGLCRVLP